MQQRRYFISALYTVDSFFASFAKTVPSIDIVNLIEISLKKFSAPLRVSQSRSNPKDNTRFPIAPVHNGHAEKESI
jgi:hypothetical protein